MHYTSLAQNEDDLEPGIVRCETKQDNIKTPTAAQKATVTVLTKVCCVVITLGFILYGVVLSLYINSYYNFAKNFKTGTFKWPGDAEPTTMRPFRILCFGDSLTAGFMNGGYAFAPYGTFLEDKLARDAREMGVEVHVRSVGFSGWTTRQMVQKADIERGTDAVGRSWPGISVALRRESFDLAIIMAGTNDLGHGYDAKEISSNLLQLFKLCQEHSVRHLLSIGIPDSGFLSQNGEVRMRRDEVDEELKQFAQDNIWATFMKFPFPYESGSRLYELAGLHFTEEGYKKMAEELYPVVKGIMADLVNK